MKSNTPTGHEVPLASMTKNAFDVRLNLLSGNTVVGRIINFDKFSITVVSSDSTVPCTYFKHALESFTRA